MPDFRAVAKQSIAQKIASYLVRLYERQRSNPDRATIENRPKLPVFSSKIKYFKQICSFFLYSTAVHAAQHHPQAFLNDIKGKASEAQEIVQHFCSNCHAEHPLIPLGAPRIGHSEDWKARLKQDPEVLWQHTNEGFHAMPARGGCFECTDEQLKKAILLMITKNT